MYPKVLFVDQRPIMDLTAPRMVAGLAAMLILFVVHLHLWVMHRQRHLALWTIGWGLALMRYGLLILLPPSLGGSYSFVTAAYTIIFALSLTSIVAGCYALAEKKFPLWIIAVTALAFGWVATANQLNLDFLISSMPAYLSLAYICFCGGSVLIGSESLDRVARVSSGMTLIFAGVMLATAGPIYMDEVWFVQWGWMATDILSSWIGISLLVLYFQTQRQELESAQRVLTARERIYRLSANTMAEGLLVVDASLTVLFVNNQFRRILGLSAGQLDVGSDLRRALTGLKSEPLVRIFLSAADKDAASIQPLEIDSFVRPRGDEVSLRISPARLRDQDGWFEGTVFLVTDITESRASARELAENRQLLQGIFSTMDEAVISLTADFKQILFFNQAADEILGLSEMTQAAGDAGLLDLVHPADRAFIEKGLEELLQSGSALWEHRVVSRGGSQRMVRSRARYSPSLGRSPARIDILVTDVTGIRLAEKELAERRWYFQALYENSMDPIIILDHDRIILDANPAAQKMFGSESRDLVGQSTKFAHLDEDMFASFGEDAHAQVASKGFWRGEWPLRDRMNKQIAMEICISTLRWGGDGLPTLMMAIMRDITERTRYERRLQDALAEKEVLLREIHHRVKNNMQVIQSLLWMQAAKLSDPGIEKILQEVERRISAMSLVHETLYQTDNIAALDLERYIRRLCGGLKQAFDGSAGNVQWNIAADPIQLDLDKAMSFGLVLNELLTNSLKHAFNGAGGVISINARAIGESLAEVSVADNGKGISDFAEQHSDTLGLTLVRGLVERQLQGQLQINRGQGTEFIIRFSSMD